MNKTKFLNHLVAQSNKDRPTDIDLKEAHDMEDLDKYNNLIQKGK